jgi:hypothetical protein
MKRSGPRDKAILSDSVLHRLNMYAVAASAAGVSVLALTLPADAKIVYTPAHVKVAPQSRYYIDFDHDGNPDVYLQRKSQYYVDFVCGSGAEGNGVAVTRVNGKLAVAIFSGATIGPTRKFLKDSSSYPGLATGNSVNSPGAPPVWTGRWANGGKGLKNRYLGVRFKAGDGHFHYGWARITVIIENPKINDINTVLLTGYAYETIPNQPIVAGDTKGTDGIPEAPDAALTTPTPEPATLGALALGVPGTDDLET